MTIRNGPASPASISSGPIGPGLIWGLDFSAEGPRAVQHCEEPVTGTFRWLHLNLADHGTRRFIEDLAILPAAVRELLLSSDTHQRALVDGEAVGCVLHDFERDFDVSDTERIGALRVALTPAMILTTRLHPLRSADIARGRLERNGVATGPAQALDLLVGAISENITEISGALSNDLQQSEEAFLAGHQSPQMRDLIRIRRRLAEVHRLLTGMRSVFKRLERDRDLPQALQPTIEKLVQQLQSLDADILGVQAQLRLLREEVDIQQTQWTNQNLYILSIVTALMLPATLVTGIFGMNTGGMPLTGPHGTLLATMMAGSTAGATYVMLRVLGFTRR